MSSSPVLRHRPRIALPHQSNVWLVQAFPTSNNLFGNRGGPSFIIVSQGSVQQRPPFITLTPLDHDGLVDCVYNDQQLLPYLSQMSAETMALVAQGSLESRWPTAVKLNDVIMINIRNYQSNQSRGTNEQPTEPELALPLGRIWSVAAVGVPDGQPDKVKLTLRPATELDPPDGVQWSTVRYSHPGGVAQKAYTALGGGFEGRYVGRDAPWFGWFETHDSDLTFAVDQLVEKFNEHVATRYTGLVEEVAGLKDKVRQLEQHIEQLQCGDEPKPW